VVAPWPEPQRCPSAKRRLQFRCEKRAFFEPFYTKNDHFTKTGSGQT
jgi:hypothetical protein